MKTVRRSLLILFLSSTVDCHPANSHQEERRGVLLREELPEGHVVTMEQRTTYKKSQPYAFFIRITRPRKDPLICDADIVFLKIPRSSEVMSLLYFTHLVMTRNEERNPHFSTIATSFFNGNTSESACKEFFFRAAFIADLDNSDKPGIVFAAKKTEKRRARK